MTNEGHVGERGRTDDGLRAVVYLADVVEHSDRDGLTVERAVVERGRGGRLVSPGRDQSTTDAEGGGRCRDAALCTSGR